MKYREYKEINFVKIAEEVLQIWKAQSIFEKSISNREGAEKFTFYEGPPSANGVPGIHHVMSRTVKDIFCRYKTLKGYQVKRKGGWDTHGLPVELQVEKQLNINKEDIGKKISIEEYNRKCKEAVMKFTGAWEKLTEQMGYWIDMQDPYITYKKEYMETVWYLLKQLYEKDLLYKGYTIQPYSPAAGTGLSSHELNQPGTYRDITDTSIVAQFKISGTEHDYFLAWTTTPWTLPANNGLAIGVNITYIKVKTWNRYTHQPIHVILARDVMSRYFKPEGESLDLESYSPGDKIIPYRIVETFKGKELLGKDYDQLLPYIPLEKPAFTVVAGDFVTTDEGTGIVHISKTFGADDYRTSLENNLPGVMVKDELGNEVPIVDKKGRFVQEITDFAGMYVKNYTDDDESDPEYKSTDTLIAIKLKEENKAFLVEKYVHSYPHCWRTDKPVLYYPLDSWFIRTTRLKERLVELNNTINWKPESTGKGRFGNWLENLVDWNLSRSRFWGTPLPIWMTKEKDEAKCIGSIEELEHEIQKSVDQGFMDASPFQDEVDLHRPYVDQVVLVSESGKPMHREPDLIDVWFDSGAMPYAQYHYPFENEEKFRQNYPADFIAEGVDQTRGWFFTLHAISVLLFDGVSFKNVVSNGLVLDKDGNKMSKRLGNAVDPFEVMAQHGPDPVRWYMMANANPWENLKFNVDGIDEVKRRFFGTLHNTYSFFALYANLDQFVYSEEDFNDLGFTESDQWILSKLNTLISKVEESYDDYEPTLAARAIQDFVTDDLSNWYVRLNRKRFWVGEMSDNKKAAYFTLYKCLITLAKLGSPVAPKYMDRLYMDLNSVSKSESVISVHLTDFPGVDNKMINKELEEKMSLAQGISSLVHSIRKNQKIKVRQPLSRILIPVLNPEFRKRIEAVESLILTEVNTKSIEYIDDTSGIIKKKAKPNFRKLGREYGPLMKDLTAAINQLSDEKITELESQGSIEVHAGGKEIVLGNDDVEIVSEDIPGWSVASDGKITVALDVTITDDLKKEGISRDLVNRIQNLRKDLGLDVQDKINVQLESNNQLMNQAVQLFKEYISGETQALSFELVDKVSNGTSFELDGATINVKVERVTNG